MLFVTRHILILSLALALMTPAAAWAQSDEVFEIRTTEEKMPPVDEYSNVPTGMMMDEAFTAIAPGPAVEEEAAKTVHNYDAALKLYREGKFSEILESLDILTQSGHHGAEELLGVMYRQGQGVPKDPDRAAGYILKAAEANRPLAQHHLGIMYYLGEGVEQDPVAALMWLHLAIVHYPDGKEKDRAREDRDTVYKELSRREKESALRAAREWLMKRGEGHLLDLQQHQP